MRKLLTLLLCLAVHGMARGQTNTYEYRYWFDDQDEAVVSGYFDAPAGHIDVNTEGLDDKPHILHIQVKDTAGVWSSPINRMFQKQTIDPAGPFTYHIWTNEDTGRMNTGTLDGDTLHLDMSHLPDGLQQLHVQVSQNGIYSAPKSKTFIKLPHTEGMGYLFCMMNIDGKPFRMERLPMSGGAATWIIDTDSLVTGIHRYTIMAITPTGYATSIREGFFVRENMASQLANQHCCYQVDGGEAVVVDGQVSGDQYHFDLDMSDIANGLHKLTYWMVSDNGATTAINSTFFMKVPLGGTGICQYDYWLNDNLENLHTTSLDKPQDPLKIISLLPVESVPLRSSNFKFTFKEEKPVIYAQNEFHIKFTDIGGQYSEVIKEFVDENVCHDVNPVAEIQPTQTFERVVDNGIRWYTVNVEEGDSVAFRSSQACTLQLYSPTCELVYKAEGNTSVKFGGINTWERGTYYLAVHDVKGSKDIMTLSYIHMDKFDVVSQNVNKVGNGGYSTITFKGHGFKDLYAVDLFNEVGDSIHSIAIYNESNATTSVVFDFLGVELGNYNALFHFTEESKIFENIIVVEEPIDIELASSVTNAAFIRPYLFTIKIQNKGNMTAYRVPVILQFEYFSYVKENSAKKPFERVSFGEFLPSLNVDWIDTTLVSKDSIELVKKFIDENAGSLHFITVYDSIKHRYSKVAFLAVDVPPNSTLSFNISIESGHGALENYYASIPSEWIPYNTHQEKMYLSPRKGGVKETMCCYREKVECVMNIITSAADFFSFFTGPQGKIADCIVDLGNTMLQFSYDVWCGNKGGKNMRDAAEDLIWDAVNGLVSCALNAIPGLSTIKNLDWVYQHIYNNIHTAMDCVSSLSEKIPNCPPDPPHSGSIPWWGILDPNAIYGFVSPSGSLFINDSLYSASYTIEFENDSILATGPANVVIVKDTLDHRLFDYSSFTPTFVKIGDQITYLDGNPNFVTTIDMRPQINSIAQVEGNFDMEKSIATWIFTTLDPMTMEPSKDTSVGFLPPNIDGVSGIGEVAFNIDLKQPLPNGTEISNCAGIVFDTNDEMMTPYWTNIIDAVAPESAITSYHIVNDSTMTLRFNGIDNLSGVWKYDVYACYGEAAAPFRVAEDVTENECDVRIYQGIVHGFFVVATDSAGNREQKFAPEVTIPIGSLRGDANGDGAVNISDVMLMVSNILGDHGVMYIFENADINGDGEVNISDVTGVVDMILNGTSSSVPQNARTALDSHLRVESNGGRGTVCLVGDERYTGCQMHLLLPEECELKDIKMNNRCKDHEMACRDLGGGHYSVVIYSLQAKEFEGGDTPLLDLTVDGIHADDVEVTDILFTNRQYESVVLPDAGHGVTGITTTSVGAKGEKTYDTQGVEVNTPAKGVYIQRGKKVVVH